MTVSLEREVTPATGRPHGTLAPKSRPPEGAGLVRPRLLDALEGRVGVVLAPAGHGKSTLLAQAAARFPGPVAWYRADSADRSVGELVDGLCQALFRSYGINGTARSCTELALELDRSAVTSALLVVDDFHELAGSPASDTVLRLVELAPQSLHVLIGARGAGELDSTLLRLSGHACVVDADDLRFRSWEVERLFRDVFGRPMSPADAGMLTARTEGWAAGLTMFQLLTADRSPLERRQTLTRLGRGSRLVRSYLVREVLGGLPPETRDFLRRTSALAVLSGPLCDALLERTRSIAVLEDLQHRQLFTSSDLDGDRFRYHQVLQDHLEIELAELLGPSGATAWYLRAAAVLRAAGEFRAAFRALVLAEDWAGVESLLHDQGEQVVSDPLGDVADALPESLAVRDPWLILAQARWLAAHGRLEEAVAAYRRAAHLAPGRNLRTLCTQEQAEYARWLPGRRHQPLSWAGLVAGAVSGQPGQSYGRASGLPGAEGRLATAATALLAGDPAAAAAHFDEAGEHPQAGPAVVRAAVYGRALADLVCSTTPDPRRARSLERTAATDPSPWWARIGRALLHATCAEAGELALLAEAADDDRDCWGGAVIRLVLGLCTGSAASFTEAAERFDSFRSRVPAHWARCLALACSDTQPSPWQDSRDRATRQLEEAGSALGAADVLGAASAWARLRRAGGAGSLPRRTSRPASPAPPDQKAQPVPPAPRHPGPARTGRAGPSLGLRLLGGFELSVAGEPVDLRPLRPRVRSTLYLLSCHADSAVHRDVLVAALWPDAPAETGYRSLQVAVSTLRGLLDPLLPGGPADPLPRSGDTYTLLLAGGGSDLLTFEAALAAAREARLDGRSDQQAAQLRAALDCYGGDLLSELGNTDWVLLERQRLRTAAADAAVSLAELDAAAGRDDQAVDLLRRALALDRFRDAAWQQLAELYERHGDRAAAQATRTQHREVLEDLGLLPPPRRPQA